MSDNAIDRLKEMVNKPFLYQNEEIVILNYCDGTGDDGTEVEIYLNNGKVLIFSIFDLVLIYISTLENHRKAGVGKSSNQK
ncbi:hypothetical protein F2Z85_21070 [Bacteroides fragilis]|uniref:Uncharacterized protein n=1 Tax=Bacteroides fragilis TaxID=817 RepID=A0A642F789_BACFG|nr:hypothetical protein [Bacteroides fragilis]MZN05575.1 hypothetical protein [Bifidobacterium pseudocatenulatum]KAA4792025.1 hypothetical protein F3B20_04805 [Bacteroides fragilis]KAA4800396.1 hypothetical protein F2045_16395 [Bacteroides fragilis]KAA4805923.1 hypothetical protein F3B17_00475 [Bacteroides fragilis]KAA4812277.1 hypothetical protein F2048_00475 [Bacteroides fragilis]